MQAAQESEFLHRVLPEALSHRYYEEELKRCEMCIRDSSHLKGCDMHSTVILSSVDMDTVKKLGMYLTCEPTYEEADRMYHKK